MNKISDLRLKIKATAVAAAGLLAGNTSNAAPTSNTMSDGSKTVVSNQNKDNAQELATVLKSLLSSEDYLETQVGPCRLDVINNFSFAQYQDPVEWGDDGGKGYVIPKGGQVNFSFGKGGNSYSINNKGLNKEGQNGEYEPVSNDEYKKEVAPRIADVLRESGRANENKAAHDFCKKYPSVKSPFMAQAKTVER